MNKIITYIAVLLFLAACSSDHIVIEPATDVAEEVAGIGVKIEAPVGLGDEFISRSSLTYDDAKDIMAFQWGNDDCIGVFTYNKDDAEHSSQQKFSQIEGDPRNTDPLLRYFETNDFKVVVDPNSKYVACLPYFANHPVNYTNIPVSYTGQRQTKPVDFSNYWNNKNDEAYKTSQQAASAHLSQYDYLCTGITTPKPDGSILFNLNRMGAVVRFWILINQENNYVYDELQLVNSSKEFTTEATMNAETKTLTATATSHVLSLQLGEDGEGFDMTEKTNNGTKSTTPFYDYYNGTYTGYIMAYMMLAPINLQGDDVEHCELYLIAHEKANPTNKHYFKATGLSKPNLQPNSFYKWTIVPGEDEPIEFSTITVEEWRKGTEFNNGDNGAGTGSW